MSDERIDRLEILAAEQERIIGDLSDVIARQDREIAELQRRLDILARRLVSVEEASAPEIASQKPPHW